MLLLIVVVIGTISLYYVDLGSFHVHILRDVSFVGIAEWILWQSLPRRQ